MVIRTLMPSAPYCEFGVHSPPEFGYDCEDRLERQHCDFFIDGDGECYCSSTGRIYSELDIIRTIGA